MRYTPRGHICGIYGRVILFESKRKNRRIASYVTVFATPLSDKRADQKTTPNDVITVIATQPLTSNEQWQKMAANHYLLFHDGESITEKSV